MKDKDCVGGLRIQGILPIQARLTGVFVMARLLQFM
jgi:hypothetical protein